jgi:hypothetical protein
MTHRDNPCPARIALAVSAVLCGSSMLASPAAAEGAAAEPGAGRPPVVEGVAGTGPARISAVPEEGRPRACKLAYTVVFEDFVHGQGRLESADVEVTVENGEAGEWDMSLALGIQSFPAAPGTRFETPHSQYFINLAGSSAGRQAVATDLPDGRRSLRFSTAQLGVYALFKGILVSGVMTVGFRRSPRSPDQQIEVDLTVKEVTVSDGAYLRSRARNVRGPFMDCVLYMSSGEPT